MEAPEKIWINPSMDLPKLNGIIDKDSIQYVRKDAFIDKACEWINLHIGELSDIYTRSAIRNEFLEDFRKAMEERL